VLLVVDSLTRLAMAQREIGLAAGEPPTAKGYTPSVFTLLARLIERAGSFGSGTITGFYTVLMEGDDENDPLVDAARALLDGHVMLDRRLAAQSHYPPISILDSISRIMPAVISAEHLVKTNVIRRLFATYKASEELIRIGAYQKNCDGRPRSRHHTDACTSRISDAGDAGSCCNERFNQSPDGASDVISRLRI